MATPARTARRPWWASCTGLAVVGLLAGMAALAWAQTHPTAAGLVLLAVIGAGTAVSVRRQRRAAALQELRAVQSVEVARYHVMDPVQFEHAIAFLCQRDGCTDVQVTGRAGDLGADVVATAPDGRRIVIQCKRYSRATKVGSPDVQRFGGTCWSVHGAAVAAVVTTSVFTEPAAQYAFAHGIRCVDESGLAGWASRTGPAPWM